MRELPRVRTRDLFWSTFAATTLSLLVGCSSGSPTVSSAPPSAATQLPQATPAGQSVGPTAAAAAKPAATSAPAAPAAAVAPAAAAAGGRTPASMDPCSVITDDDMRAALAAVSSTGAASSDTKVSRESVAHTEEPPDSPGASAQTCKVHWGANSTLVTLLTRKFFDSTAVFGKPVTDLGGDKAFQLDEVPYVLKGNIAVSAQTGGSGGTLRLHREVVKRAAANL
jgi:hypothetical protein